MHPQPQHPFTRSDSPSDNSNPNMLHHLHSQDPLYSIHGPQSGLYSNSNLNNSMHIASDYPADFDAQKHQQHAAKLNGFSSNNSRASFSAYPNTNRPRHLNSQFALNSISYRDTPPFYPASSDVYQAQLTSPVQSNAQPYDYVNGQSNLGGGHKSYLIESYAGAIQHQKPSAVQQQVQHNGYSSVGHYPTFSSQTPYGPHVPTSLSLSTNNGTGATGNAVAPPGLSASASLPINTGNNPSSNQEEISTIFVVGFPDDMQEREFQNMFTFSPGFEAATLKIPNKEYTAYGGVVTPGAPNVRGGFQGYSGSNDPYNLVTVNQGGVVVDGGRDGTMASWPASVPGDESVGNGAPFMNGMNMPPRKQIIGFAKFRSREEALGARDVLQGRRVDIEKGAVLKAEMAKKNLHTKRGVGPVPANGAMGGGGGGGSGLGPALGVNNIGSLQQSIMNGVGLGGGIGSDLYSMNGGDGLTVRDLGHMGLGLGAPNRLSQWREQTQQDIGQGTSSVHLNGALSRDEEEKRREREASIFNAMSLNSGTRGPRERAEEEERERKRREKELRLRASNSTAFDAFHSVPMQQISAPSVLSRQSSNINGSSLLPPPVDSASGSGLGSSPSMGSAFPTSYHSLQSHLQSQQHQDEIVGPWDKLNKMPSTNIAPGRPRSSSQRSTSPNSIQSANNIYADAVKSFSPSPEQRIYQIQDVDQPQRQHHVYNESSASSIAGGSQGGDSCSLGVDSGLDAEMARNVDGLALNTSDGNTSPQLPSPASGASSGSARNAIDQNPPINTLYVGNLPTSPPPVGFPNDYLEESLRALFSKCAGYRRLCFRHKSNGPMCFVEFEDVHYATKALNDLYGDTLKGLIKGGGIRLSYSKNPLGVRTPSAGSSNGSLQQQQQQPLPPTTQGGGSFFQLDSYQSRRDDPPQPPPPRSTILRREINGLVAANNFISSPPPRFYTTSPGSAGPFSNSSSTPLSGSSSAFIPRGNGGSMNLFGYSLAASGGLSNSLSSTFSPFGMSNLPHHQTIPDQSPASDDQSPHSSQHFIHHRTMSPPASNLEAARAG